VVGAPQRRAAVRYLQSHYKISERRGCALVSLARSVMWYQPTRPPQDALRRRICEIAETRVRYGYKRIHVMLRREGWAINHKRVHRLYCEEGLQLRSKRPRRHVTAAHRQRPRTRPRAPNQAWSMDFVSDQLQGGHRFRALTLVDVFTRECLAIEPGRQLGGEDVVKVLERVAVERGAPRRIFCDNGSEFAGCLVDLWAYRRKVMIEFSRPGKPTDNAYIESFNGSLRDECLNVHWFSTLDDARAKLEAWRQEYNESRPHRALNNQSPTEYAAQWS
jgi:putative transposase